MASAEEQEQRLADAQKMFEESMEVIEMLDPCLKRSKFLGIFEDGRLNALGGGSSSASTLYLDYGDYRLYVHPFPDDGASSDLEAEDGNAYTIVTSDQYAVQGQPIITGLVEEILEACGQLHGAGWGGLGSSQTP